MTFDPLACIFNCHQAPPPLPSDLSPPLSPPHCTTLLPCLLVVAVPPRHMQGAPVNFLSAEKWDLFPLSGRSRHLTILLNVNVLLFSVTSASDLLILFNQTKPLDSLLVFLFLILKKIFFNLSNCLCKFTRNYCHSHFFSCF